jgi:hypothetical protein
MKSTSLLTLLLLCAANAALGLTNLVTFEWPAKPQPFLAGYVIALGTNSGFSTNGPILMQSDVLTSTNYTYTNLVLGPHYRVAVKCVSNGEVLDSDWTPEGDWNSMKLQTTDAPRRQRVEIEGQIRRITINLDR